MTEELKDEISLRPLNSSFFCGDRVLAAYRGMLAAESMTQDDDVFSLLVALGYCSLEGMPTGDEKERASREGLLDVAARLDWVAPLTHLEAGPPYLFGAQASCAAFGISDHVVSSLPVGGRGLSVRAAFEGCIGEAIEALSLEGLCGHEQEELPSFDLVTGATGPSLPQSILRRVASASMESHLGSSGCAVGVSQRNARIAALFELLERDALGLWWHGGCAGSAFSDSQAILATVFGNVQASGRRRWQLDISTKDLRLPVIIALSSTDDGRGVILGASAGRTLAEAGLNAALELYQMEYAASLSFRRARAGKPLLEGDRLWLDRLRQHDAEIPCYRARAGEGNGEALTGDDLLDDLTDRLVEIGGTILAVDLSRSNLPLPCVRVISPVLQSMSGVPVTPRLAATVLRSPALRNTYAPIVSPI